MKVRDINLNERLGEIRNQTVHHESVSIRFGNIAPWVAEQLRTVARVEGCLAWLSDPVLITALSKVHADLVVTSDKLHTKKRFAKLTSVRRVGRQRGRRRPLMHHKFLVGLSKGNQPVWVLTGSMNWSLHAAHNLEHALLITDPAVARTFREEFQRIRAISRAL